MNLNQLIKHKLKGEAIPKSELTSFWSACVGGDVSDENKMNSALN